MLAAKARKRIGMPVRTRLKEILEARGIKRMELVRKAGLSYPTILKWEKDALRELDTGVLTALLKYLDIKYEDFVYEVEDERGDA